LRGGGLAIIVTLALFSFLSDRSPFSGLARLAFSFRDTFCPIRVVNRGGLSFFNFSPLSLFF